MTTLKEIDAQLAALQAQREEIRQNELNSTIDKVRSLGRVENQRELITPAAR